MKCQYQARDVDHDAAGSTGRSSTAATFAEASAMIPPARCNPCIAVRM